MSRAIPFPHVGRFAVKLPRRRSSVFLTVSGAMCVGAVLLVLLGSWALGRAHRGDGFAFLQEVLDARDVHPASYYQLKLLKAVGALLAAGVFATALVCASTSRWFFQKFVGGASAEALAFVRILICAILFVDAVSIDLGQAAIFPAAVRLPMGVIDVLERLPIGFEHLNGSATALRLWQTATVALLALALFGWRTRFVLPLAFAFYLVQGGIIRQYDRLFHTGLTPMYVLGVLCFTPCGDAWSLDRRRRERRGLPVPPPGGRFAVYGWSRYVCWVPIAITYVEAGLTKIVRAGSNWWVASNLRSIFLRDAVERAELRPVFIPHLIAAPDVLFAAAGLFTLVAEVLFFLVLFSVVLRRILPALMMLMHLGIWVFQGIKFFDLVFLQFIFVDVDRVRAWARSGAGWRRLVAVGAAAAEPRNVPAAAGGAAAAGDDAHADDAPARGAWRVRCAYPLSGCAIVLVMLGVWSRQIEFYPLSSMNLYASFNGTSVIRHLRVYAHYDGGKPERVYLQDLVDLLERTNYRQSIARGFLPADDPHGRMARMYVRACADAHNRARPGRRIRSIEVQEWTWDYRKAPGDHDFGDVARRYVVPIPQTPAASAR